VVRIKVCGITRREDAFLAADLGVDALGFIFAPSPRQVSPEDTRRIIKSLPPFIERVGVFVNEMPEKVVEISSFCLLTALQFHGDEAPLYCEKFSSYKIIKSFSIEDKIPDNISSYKVDAYLLDTYCREKRGGTGKVFNWDIAKKVKELGFPLILSGGLTPDNVVEAINKVRPYAVDVASGVEKRPGKKSKKKMKDFIRMVRENDKTLQFT